MGRVSKAQRVSQKKKASKPPSKPPISKFLKPKVTKKKTKRPPKVIKTIKKPTRPTVTRPTPRPKRPPTVFRPPPRDDFERSLTPTIIPRAFAQPSLTAPQRLGVSVRELLGVSPERIPQPPPTIQIRPRDDISTATSVQALFAPREQQIRTRAGRGGRQVAVTVPRPTPRTSVQAVQALFAPVPTVSRPPTTRTPLTSQERQAQARAVPIEVQREANLRALEASGDVTFGEAQARDLDPVTGFIQSFGGGARQEFENIGAIAGLGTAREEVGSLAVDLPFAVGEALFTREAPEGEGFFGLGFDFRPIGELGFEEAQRVSGVQQEKIGRKFAEDPARALGSIATIGAIEAGLFVATGGIGNVARRGIVGIAGRVATKKQTKIAQELARKADVALGEKNVGQFLEPIGDGRFHLSRGIDGLGNRGISVIKGDQAIIVRKTVNKAGDTIETVKEIKLFKGVKEAKRKKTLRPDRTLDETELELKRLGLTTETSTPRAVLGARSDVPSIIIDTKTRTIVNVAGEKIKVPPRIIGFNREVLAQGGLSPLQRPELVRIAGVQTKVFQSVKNQIETGLRPVKGKSLTIEGKPTDSTLSAIRAQERSGFTQAQARGFVFLTSDALKNPKEIFGIIKTQKTLPREALTPTELRTGRIGERKLSSLDEITSIGERPINVPTFEIFGSQALSPTAGIEFVKKASVAGLNVDDFFKGIVKSGKSTKATPKAKAPSFDEAEKALDKFAKEQGGFGQRSITTKGTPRQTSLRKISEAFEGQEFGFETTSRGLFLPRGARPRVRAPTGVRPLVVSVIPTELARQVDDLAQISGVGVGEGIRLDTGQRLVSDVIPELGVKTTNIFEPAPPRETVIPQFGVGQAQVQEPFLGQITIPTFGTPILPPRITTRRPPPRIPSLFGGAPPPVFPFGEQRRRRKIKKGRRSRLGRRIFDVADEPFGALTVGLGFFAEQETGRETIAELIGDDDRVLTRQERQARARLGRGGGRRRRQNFAEGFGLGDFFG